LVNVIEVPDFKEVTYSL